MCSKMPENRLEISADFDAFLTNVGWEVGGVSKIGCLSASQNDLFQSLDPFKFPEGFQGSLSSRVLKKSRSLCEVISLNRLKYQL